MPGHCLWLPLAHYTIGLQQLQYKGWAPVESDEETANLGRSAGMPKQNISMCCICAGVVVANAV